MKKLSKSQASKKYIEKKYGKSSRISKKMVQDLKKANKEAIKRIKTNEIVYKSSNAHSNYNVLTEDIYEKHKNNIRNDELQSKRYELVSKFMDDFYTRDYTNLEDELFNIIGNYNMEKEENGKSIEEKTKLRLSRLFNLINFMNGLSHAEIFSNIYLSYVKYFLDNALIDSISMCIGLQNQNYLTSSYDSNENYLESSFYIDKNISASIPCKIEIYVETLSKNSKTNIMSILDEENIELYKDYNEVVRKINLLLNDIYKLYISAVIKVGFSCFSISKLEFGNVDNNQLIILGCSKKNLISGISNAKDVMDKFMEKLDSIKISHPYKEEFDPSEEAINERIKSYSRVLNSSILSNLDNE